MTDTRWLFLLCASRAGFALINVCYSALIPTLRTEWQMTASQAGLVQSAWHAGYVVSLVAAGMIAGRHGARRTFIIMGYAACATTLLFAYGATGFHSGLLLYGLAGLCAGGSYVPGLSLIAERFPPATRGRAMGCYIAAASLGYALSLAGSGALAAHLGPRAVFLFAAAGTLWGVVVALYALRQTPNVITPSASGFSLTSLRWLWRHKPARIVILAYAFHAWELLGMWAWLPAFLTAAAANQPGTAFASGTLLAAFTHLISTAGSLSGGALSDRWGRIRAILLMAIVSAVCSLAFGWMLAAPPWLLIVVAALFNVSAIGDSAIYSAALSEAVPPVHLPTAYSVRSVLGFGAGALSPWLFGVALDQVPVAELGWGAAWSMLGLVALAGPWMSYRLYIRQGKAVQPEPAMPPMRP